MRRLSLAILCVSMSLCALIGAMLSVWLLGFGAPSVVISFLLWMLVATISFVLAQKQDNKIALGLHTIESAVGVKPNFGDNELARIKSVVASLCSRLERANHFKLAFAELPTPALLCSDTGEVIATTSGFVLLEPGLTVGGNVNTFPTLSVTSNAFGAAPAGREVDRLSKLGGVSFAHTIEKLSETRFLLSFEREGITIPAKSYQSFTDALVSGDVGFRFDKGDLRNSPKLDQINQGFAALEESFAVLSRALDGDPQSFERARGLNSGFSTHVRSVCSTIVGLSEQIGDEVHVRQSLEHKLEQIEHFIMRNRASAARIDGFVASARQKTTVLQGALDESATGVREVSEAGRIAKSLVEEAGAVAQRSSASSSAVAQISGQIQKMVEAIEDVAFRTNLLALNAAVEAARAGVHGRSFAVVADEVRTLAQTASATSKDIKNLVGKGLAESDVGSGEAIALEKMITKLDGYLRNLSSDTDIVTSALDGSVGTLTQLEGDIAKISDNNGTKESTKPLPQAHQRRA